jgi:hypothetical protein
MACFRGETDNATTRFHNIYYWRRRVEGDERMINEAEERGKIIKHLEDALAIAEEIGDGTTGYLIEQALDEARSRLFVPRASRP